MLGAIVGDIAGSRYEFHPWQGHWSELELFPEGSGFTDDTVMTMAVAQALADAGPDATEAELEESLVDAMHVYGRKYPRAGYGGRFRHWLREGLRQPYNSFGNGSAMRVSPVGWLYDDLDTVERIAACTARVTRNHPEGIKGAQSVAGSIFLARQGRSKADIRDYVTGRHGYDLARSLADIKPTYGFDVTCQGSVPESIIAFLESENFEDAVRKAVWLGGDADTQAAIAGSIAEAFYGGVPDDLAQEALARLDAHLWQRYVAWRELLGEKI